MRPDNSNLTPFYPDVLGAITSGPRINMDALETAIGIHPKLAYINQPIEVIIVLQSMVNEEMQLKVAIRLPNMDRKGNVAVMEAGKIADFYQAGSRRSRRFYECRSFPVHLRSPARNSRCVWRSGIVYRIVQNLCVLPEGDRRLRC